MINSSKEALQCLDAITFLCEKAASILMEAGLNKKAATFLALASAYQYAAGKQGSDCMIPLDMWDVYTANFLEKTEKLYMEVDQ